MKQLGWKLVSQDRPKGTIEARTGSSLRSWGEDVSIKLAEKPTGTTITVASGVSFQIFDWGKNEENENLLHKKLRETISR